MQYLWSIHGRYSSIAVEELKLVASTTPVVKLPHKRASYTVFECNNHSAISVEPNLADINGKSCVMI